jgi:hypothetical protein
VLVMAKLALSVLRSTQERNQGCPLRLKKRPA